MKRLKFSFAPTLAPLIVLCITVASAQPPDTLWTRTIDGFSSDEGQGLLQMTDGGFLIAGPVYSYTTSYDFQLIRTDNAGNIIWQHAYVQPNADRPYDVQQTLDGGFAIVGSTIELGLNARYDVLLIKTDADGNEEWQRTYGGLDDDEGYSLKQTNDGGYIISGYSYSFGSRGKNTYLFKTDANGNLIWQHIYYGGFFCWGKSVQITQDGGYIIGGTRYSTSTEYDIQLIKTDGQGNQDWQRIYGGLGYNYGNAVLPTADGGFVITGSTVHWQYGSLDVVLLKTDSHGNLEWWKNYGGHDNEEGHGFLQMANGDYVIVGTSNSFTNGYSDVYLLKTDAEGGLIWQCVFGGTHNDEGFCLQQTPDGGFAVLGGTFSFGGVYKDYLIRTNSGGGVLSVATAPLNPPIVIPANGGSFQYDCTIQNWTSGSQTFQHWCKVRDSIGQYFNVFGPITRTLPGSANPTRTLTQVIAAIIPSGFNTYITYIGTYPDTIIDSSFFTITKLAISNGGPWFSESGVSGDLFEELGQEDVGICHDKSLQPDSFILPGVFPNPFNPTTTIRFTLPQAAQVTLEVFDIWGRIVGVQHVEPLQAGSHKISFDGSGLPSGVYLYRLTAGELKASGKMVLLK